MPENNIQTYCPTDKADWRKWLEANHETSQSVWLIYYKSNSPKHNLTWSEAVDEALCFGWIDGIRKSLDDEKFTQLFGKRKPRSTWSKINKEKVEKLIKSGLMKKAGLERIKVAKENGSWTLLDEAESLIIPDDLEKAFNAKPGSKDYFLSLSKSVKKMMLQWIILGKRAETRQKRISEVVTNAGKKQKPKQFR